MQETMMESDSSETDLVRQLQVLAVKGWVGLRSC